MREKSHIGGWKEFYRLVLTSLVRKSAFLNNRIVLLKDQTSKWSESATHLHLIECYTNIFVTPWNRVETSIKKIICKMVLTWASFCCVESMCRNHDRCKNDLPNVFVCTASHSYLTTFIASTFEKLQECSTEGVE